LSKIFDNADLPLHHGTKLTMLPLRRAILKSRVTCPCPQHRASALRPRLRQRGQRHSSNSTKTTGEGESTAQTTSTPIPGTLNELRAGESAKPAEPVDVPIQLWYHRLGPVSHFFKWFHRTQTKRPYTVQLCTTLTTYLCGDLLAQDIGGELYDPWRTARMLTIGAIAAIPGYKWYVKAQDDTSTRA
jgi:hypothetical protein